MYSVLGSRVRLYSLFVMLSSICKHQGMLRKGEAAAAAPAAGASADCPGERAGPSAGKTSSCIPSFIFVAIPFASNENLPYAKGSADVTHAAISEELQESEAIFPLTLLLNLSV